MRFKTASGSEYEMEVTHEELWVRRLTGTLPPTQRQGTDWKLLVNNDLPKVGQPYLMHWNTLSDGTMQCTLTSPVTEVCDV